MAVCGKGQGQGRGGKRVCATPAPSGLNCPLPRKTVAWETLPLPGPQPGSGGHQPLQEAHLFGGMMSALPGTSGDVQEAHVKGRRASEGSTCAHMCVCKSMSLARERRRQKKEQRVSPRRPCLQRQCQPHVEGSVFCGCSQGHPHCRSLASSSARGSSFCRHQGLLSSQEASLLALKGPHPCRKGSPADPQALSRGPRGRPPGQASHRLVEFLSDGLWSRSRPHHSWVT